MLSCGNFSDERFQLLGDFRAYFAGLAAHLVAQDDMQHFDMFLDDHGMRFIAQLRLVAA